MALFRLLRNRLWHDFSCWFGFCCRCFLNRFDWFLWNLGLNFSSVLRGRLFFRRRWSLGNRFRFRFWQGLLDRNGVDNWFWNRGSLLLNRF
jgi:hypothetical protein